VDYLLRQATAAHEANIHDTVYVADVILSAVDVDLYVFQRHERHYSPEQFEQGSTNWWIGSRPPRPLPDSGAGFWGWIRLHELCHIGAAAGTR
jgi:hypothetical protein